MRSVKDEYESDVTRMLAQRVAALRRSIDSALAALEAPVDLGAHGSSAGGVDGFLDPLRKMLDAAAGGGGQREILRALLTAAAQSFPRTVLFILRGPALVSWEARRATGPDSPPEVPGHLAIPARGDHLLARALDAGGLQLGGAGGPGFVLTEALGGLVPTRSGAMPLLVRGRAVAVLYGDNAGSGSPVSEGAFEVIGRIGGLTLESLAAVRRQRPAAPGARVAGVTVSERPSVTDWNSAPAPAAPSGPRSGVDPFPPLEDPHAGPGGREAPATPEPAHTVSGATVALPSPPEDAEMQALLSDLDGAPRRESADDGLSPDDRRQHQDARRFASLLVSELLLYNEEAVILGRKHGDLARRLAKEIQKSRQAYKSRISDRLGGASRYFDEEMVRVLAEGDAGLLRN